MTDAQKTISTLTVCLAVLASWPQEAFAQARGGATLDTAAPGLTRDARRHFWTASVFANTTDNFARIEAGPFERRFQNPDGAFLSANVIFVDENGQQLVDEQGDPLSVLVPITDRVPIDTVSKAFTTLSLSGSSVVERPQMQGVVQGFIRAGGFFDDANTEETFQDRINSGIPQFAADRDAVGTIGDIDFDRYFLDANMSGLMDFDIVGDALGLETGGFLIEQNLLAGGQLQVQQPGQNFDSILVGGIFVSPVATARLPRQQELEFRYRNSSVFVIEEFDVTGGGLNQTFDNSFGNEGQISYRTGNIFGRNEFDANVFIRRLVEEGSEDLAEQRLKQNSGSVGWRYAVNPRFSTVTSLGYDDITAEVEPFETPGTPAQPGREVDFSGVFFSSGFDYQPSRQSRLRFQLGYRYEGLFVNSQGTMQVSPHWTWSVQANRTITSGFQNLQQQFASLGTAFLNRATGINEGLSDRGVSANAGFGSLTALSTNTGGAAINLNTGVQTSLRGNYGRTTYEFGLGGNFIDGADDAPGGAQSRNQYRGTAFVNHALTRRATVTAIGQLSLADSLFGAARLGSNSNDIDGLFDQLYTVRWSFGLSRDVRISAEYQHFRRNIDGTAPDLSFFNGRLFEYQENQVRGGVQFVF
ncbi:MAG: hypothetical protein AAGG79_00450 [Pseudomonadota bacterium]